MPFYDLRWGATPCAVIREGDFKLIEYFGDHVDLDTGEYRLGHRLELFNLREDLGERLNLAAKLPQRAADLQKELRAWIRSTGAEIPAPNPRYDPKRALLETRDQRAAWETPQPGWLSLEFPPHCRTLALRACRKVRPRVCPLLACNAGYSRGAASCQSPKSMGP
jgi:hypothetical protein